MVPTVALSGVEKFFGDLHVIKNVHLTVEDGEFVVFVGPSGCGKSTMLRVIAGLEDVNGGSVEIEGSDVTALGAAERRLAMVFQSYALYPHMNVRENLGFGLKMTGIDPCEINRRVMDAADILQITPLLERRPRALSGGQRQRVAIGRAIVRAPAAFLFDEPLSNLDAALRVKMRIELARLRKRLGKTVIYVTHDQVEAMTLADRIVVFDGGTIRQQGAPLDLYHRPANLFVARFIGSPQMNVLPCGSGPDGLRFGKAAQKNAAGGPQHFGIRSEHFRLAREETPALSGQVVAVERLGSDSFVYIEIPDVTDEEPLSLRLPGDVTVRDGETLELAFSRENAHFFDTDGQRINDFQIKTG